MTLLTVLKPKDAGLTPATGTPVTQDGTTPNLIVEIDFDTPPTQPIRTWTDITTDIRQISYQLAGRQNELQRTEAGTLNATLNNRSGDYDPTNTAGAHYPNVKRTRWIRVRSVWAGVIYPEWQGLIESFTGQWPSAGFDATVQIIASDASKPLNLFDLNGHSFDEQTTGQRAAAVAAAANVTVGTTDIGISILPAITFTSATSALSHLQAVEETEAGLIYPDATGALTFEDRHRRALHNGTPLATIGDDDGEIPYRDSVQFNYDDSNIWPRVVVTPAQPADGSITPTPQVATNEDSIADHYERTLTRTILVEEEAEALAAAQWLANLYAEPAPRLPACEVIGRKIPTAWPVILACKNSDRFTWKRRPSTEGAPRTIDLDVYVERKTTTVTPGTDWAVSLQFSPASDEDLFIWDVSDWDSGAVWTY